MAVVKPFRAERYDESKAGPLERLVAPPYDVLSPREREEYLARSPYNVVHLTLPDDEEQAGRDVTDWRERGVLARDEEPGYWLLSQDYAGPDGVSRTRTGLVASLRAEPYENGVVLPHERTHSGPKEGRLRLLRATRTQLEPIFLLYEGDPLSSPAREPDLRSGGDKLWRVEDAPDFENTELLIADGHHRYETAVAYAQEGGSPYLMVVLVPTEQEGLTIFPTHRMAERVNGAHGTPIEKPGDVLPGVVMYRDGKYELLNGDGLDAEIVERIAPDGVTYTPERAEAVATVDRGDADAARRCLRRAPTSIPSSLRACSSTRLTDWLALCRAAVEDVRGVLAELPLRADREPVVGSGKGGDETTAIDAAAERAILAHFAGLDGLTIVSEEVGTIGSGETFVVVDPIDGSLNAKRGIGFFALSIAVASGPTMGDVHFGFVHDFGTEEEWTATRGDGARLDGTLLERELPKEQIEILAFEATRTASVAEKAAAVVDLAYRLRIMGSLALSLCHLAAGRIDAVCSLKPARAVDIAAAQLLVLERGLAIDLPDAPPFAAAPLDVEGRSRVVAAGTSELCRQLAAALG
jgi:myo-inositol-1(or 4)-monophosphatase